jgi:CheY-like chemotaxis protein
MPKILLVDDDLSNVLPVVLALEQAGHAVTWVASTADAMTALLQHPVECLITDYEMPGQDGVQLCRAVRTQPAFAALPIVMMSAAPEPLARGRLWTRFLRKPIAVAEFLRVVDRLAGNDRCITAGTEGHAIHAVARRFQYLAPQTWCPIQSLCWP